MSDDKQNPDQIVAWVNLKSHRGLNAPDSEEAQRRVDLYDRYLGEKYGDEEEGYSSVTTREVFEAVQWVKPDIMETVFSGDEILEFRPNGPEDIQAAKQETKAINNLLLNRKDIYEAVSDWVDDWLIYPTGYLKVWWDEAERWEERKLEGQTPEQMMMVNVASNARPDLEWGGYQETENGLEVIVYQLNPQTTGLRVESVPPEEVIISNNCDTLNLDQSDYVDHYSQKTKSDLIAMGVDRDIVDNLQTSQRIEYNSERENRARFETEYPGSGDIAKDELEIVECHEVYCLYDYDMDGIAERMRFFIAGDELIEAERCDYQPFCSMSAITLPHRHFGLSYAETVLDIQERATTITRQMFDNLYRTNRPRQFVTGGVNMDQMMNYVPDGLVEVDNPGDVAPEVIPVAVQHILPALESLEDEKGRRTGISKYSQDVNPAVLAESTFGAYMMAQEKGNRRTEMLIRNFAEIGLTQMARKVHQIMRSHQDVPMMMEINNQWQPVNPLDWTERTDLKVKIGLGTGTKDVRLNAKRAWFETQMGFYERGMATEANLYETGVAIAKLLGEDIPEQALLDPRSPEYAQRMQQKQQQQAQQQQMMLEAQTGPVMADIQRRADEGQAKLALEAMKEQNDMHQWAVDTELEYSVDIPNAGLEKAPEALH